MKIIDFTLKEGFFKKKIVFNNTFNLVYSKENSSGKTTFIRTLLYTMGYPIPSTKGIKFDNMEFWLTISSNDVEYKLYRHASYMTVDDGHNEVAYSVPTDFYEIQGMITGCKNKEIVDSLLGAFYVDQEKGWTLLNRGKVIGNIPFNIENLVRALAGKDCSEQLRELKAINREIKKYEYMYSVSQYQSEVNEAVDNIVYDSADEIIDKKIEILRVEREPIEEELKQIKDILRKNKLLAEYINEMKLLVYDKNGEIINVTSDNLVGFEDEHDFLVARRELLAGDLKVINKRIEVLESKKTKEEVLIKVQSSIEEFDRNISKMKVDAVATKKIIDKLKEDRANLKKLIDSMTKTDNGIVDKLYKYISLYSSELKIDEKYVSSKKDYIFTNDLKSLSGTILHKIVFSFKLAYIKIIREETGLVLPIIMDSPSGREVKHETVIEMLEILKRDYAMHQIIIASIHNFEWEDKNIIEFKERLFDNEDLILGEEN